MVDRAPNIQALIIITTYTFSILAVGWIYADARARRAEKPLFAALAVLLLGPLWLAFYLTDRPLCAHERRRASGFATNLIANLTIAWTAAMTPWLGVAAFAIARGDVSAAGRRLLFAAAGWLTPIAIALIAGYFLRRPDEATEAAKAEAEPAEARRAPARTPIPLAAVSALAAILTFTILMVLFKRAA
jgi:hypothetical protein